MRTKLKLISCVAVSFVLISLAFKCICTSLVSAGVGRSNAALAAAALAMPDGGYRMVTPYNTDATENQNNTYHTTTVSTEETTTQSTTATIDETVFTEDPALFADDVQLPVFETRYTEGDTGCDNFYIKNATAYTGDFGGYLRRPLPFDFENNKEKVQVLIVHTHSCESYITYDNGYYHESFYPRSEDKEKNMIRVGRAVAEGLEAQGIGVVHAQEIHDSPAYNGAYYRSYDTIMKYIEEYPDIKVVLDLHRDSISYGSGQGKAKPTFTYNGIKAAQIMIMAGYDPDGYYDFPRWEENLTFALKLQKTCEDMYPGMTRPLYFGNFVYNMNVNTGSLLIEVGTDVNTLSEAVHTGKLLSNVLARVLQTG